MKENATRVVEKPFITVTKQEVPKRHGNDYFEISEQNRLSKAYSEVKESREYQKLSTEERVRIEHEFYQSFRASEFLTRVQGILNKKVG